MLSQIRVIENKMKEFTKELYPELNLVFIHQPSVISTTSGIYSSSEKKIQLNWSVIENNLGIMQKTHPSFTLETLVWSVLVHEIGHHVDYINDQFQIHFETGEKIWNVVIQGDKYKIKDVYAEYFDSLIQLETRAWDYGELFLPPSIDKILFLVYRERCLSSYQKGFKSIYRGFFIKTDIVKWIGKTLDSNTDYHLHFDDYGNTRLDNKENTYYLNLSNETKRNRTFINAISASKELAVQIFDKLLNLKDIEYPFFIKKETELTSWFDKGLEQIEENINIIISNFMNDEVFISLYREIKLKELRGVLEIKQGYFEHLKNKSLV